MPAIGSFVLDESYGFTQAGTSRINDSIMTYVWAILGDQAQIRSSNIGEMRKQFLVNVDDAINSVVSAQDATQRYQDVLQHARSKLDFVLGADLYMIPSDMNLRIGTINGYNNLIQRADGIENVRLGQNNVNDEPAITQVAFKTPPDDFDEATPDEAAPDEASPDEATPDEATPDEATPDDFSDKPIISQDTISQNNIFQDQLTHDETKLFITLSGVIGGTFLIWYLKA